MARATTQDDNEFDPYDPSQSGMLQGDPMSQYGIDSPYGPPPPTSAPLPDQSYLASAGYATPPSATPPPQQATAQPYATTREGAGVTQDQYNQAYEPGRVYQPMAGFDTNRINDPNEQDPKYVMARIIQNMGLNPEDPASAGILFQQLQQRFPGVTRNGDVLDFSAVPGIGRFGQPVPQDFIVNSSPGGTTGPGASWGFMNIPGYDDNTGAGGGAGVGGPGIDLGGMTTGTGTGTSNVPTLGPMIDNGGTATEGGVDNPNSAFGSSIRDQILKLLGQGPVSANDPDIAPAINAYRTASQRALAQERDAIAERMNAQGLLNSGAFDTATQHAMENAGSNEAQFSGNLVAQQAMARRQQITDLLQLGGNILSNDDRNALQLELAKIDQQIRMSGLGLQAGEFIANLNRGSVLDLFGNNPFLG